MYARTPTVSVDNSVDRTIATRAINDLKVHLGIDEEAFIKLENIFTQDTFESGVNADIDKNSIENPLVEYIEAKITSRKLNGLSVGSFLNDATPIFNNKHISISTEFINYEMIISFTYKTKSKVAAKKLENSIKDYYHTKGAGYFHNIDYYYIIPDNLLLLLEDIYTTGKVNYDDNKTFIDFLRDGDIYNVITVRSDVNGIKGNVGLAALGTTTIKGLYENDISTTVAEHETDKGEWSLTLDYKLNYMSPESFIVDFEILVNNTELPEHYSMDEVIAPDRRRIKDNLYDFSFTAIPYVHDYVAVPPYDNHRPLVSMTTNVVSPLMSILVMVEPLDLRTLCNLSELEYYVFSDDVIAYFKDNHQYLTMTANPWYNAMFMLDLYKDNEIQPKSMITLDSNLNISATVDLDITATYRLVLSLISDKNIMSPRARASLNRLDKERIENVFTGAGKDFRESDGIDSKYLIPVSDYRRITAQVSTIRTFLKGD